MVRVEREVVDLPSVVGNQARYVGIYVVIDGALWIRNDLLNQEIGSIECSLLPNIQRATKSVSYRGTDCSSKRPLTTTRRLGKVVMEQGLSRCASTCFQHKIYIQGFDGERERLTKKFDSRQDDSRYDSPRGGKIDGHKAEQPCQQLLCGRLQPAN
ncbi:hypothetical protein KCV07_g94, partial [Aureobasidium melanogenum]